VSAHGVDIRPAEEGDFEEVTRLLESMGRPAVGVATRERCRDLFESQVGSDSAEHLVAADGGRLSGFCSVHYRRQLNFPAEQAWIPDLVVDARDRRRGIGRALLEEAERRACSRGCYGLTLESGYQRAEAHHLYRRFGMRDLGKYFGKGLE